MARPKAGAKQKTRTKSKKAQKAGRIIHINKNGKASPSNLKIRNGETFAFKITGTKTVASVVFLGRAGKEFLKKDASGIRVSAAQPSATLKPKKINLTVDYEIKLGSRIVKPFSIQVGKGPLTLTIDTNGNTDLPDSSIPDLGTVTFKNQAGKVARITFSGDKALFDGANPVASPQDIKVGGTIGPFTGKGKNKKVKYHIDLLDTEETLPKIEMLSTISGTARGNGTIKVGQT
jgi:hypothetical protein